MARFSLCVVAVGLAGTWVAACSRSPKPVIAPDTEHVIAPPPEAPEAVDPVLLTHVLRGLTFLATGYPAAAVPDLRLSLLYHRDSPFLHERLALAWAASGDVSHALAVLEDGLARAPRSPSLNLIAGELHIEGRRYRKAVAALQLASVDDTLLTQAGPLLVDAMLWMEDTRVAEAEATRLMARAPADANLARALGAVLEDHGRLTTALAAYRHAREQRPSDATLVASEARVLSLFGHYRDASSTWATLLAYYPDDAEIYGEITRLLHYASDGAADTYYAAARAQNRDDPRALTRLASSQLPTSYRGQAVAELAEISQRWPLEASTQLALAQAKADDDDASGCLAALTPQGKSSALYHLRARCLAMLGDLAGAVAASRQAIDNAAPTATRDELLSATLVLARYATDETAAVNLLGTLLQQLKLPAEAEETLLARVVLLDYFDRPEALRLLERLQPATSNRPELLLLWAELASRHGRRQAVIERLSTLVRKNPQNPVLLNALGFTLAETDRGLTEAAVLTRRAHRLAPNQAFIKDSLAWVAHRKGDSVTAARWLEEALAYNPNDAEILLHLGDTYHALGKDQKARACYEKALQGRPPTWLRRLLGPRHARGAT